MSRSDFWFLVACAAILPHMPMSFGIGMGIGALFFCVIHAILEK